MEKKAVVVLHSGGLDSTVLLWEAVSLYGVDNVLSFGVDYGQRHRRELLAAEGSAQRAGVERVVVDLSDLGRRLSGSSQTDPSVPVPHGHYAAESMKITVVPNRNMVLVACAAAVAISRGAQRIAYAAHAGDHAIYPDCRPEFADALDHALGMADWHPTTLWRPFINRTKTDLVRRGVELGVPFALTWSCYQGGEAHCGRCGTCTERLEAFLEAGVADPVPYELVR